MNISFNIPLKALNAFRGGSELTFFEKHFWLKPVKAYLNGVQYVEITQIETDQNSIYIIRSNLYKEETKVGAFVKERKFVYSVAISMNLLISEGKLKIEKLTLTTNPAQMHIEGPFWLSKPLIKNFLNNQLENLHEKQGIEFSQIDSNIQVIKRETVVKSEKLVQQNSSRASRHTEDGRQTEETEDDRQIEEDATSIGLEVTFSSLVGLSGSIKNILITNKVIGEMVIKNLEWWIVERGIAVRVQCNLADTSFIHVEADFKISRIENGYIYLDGHMNAPIEASASLLFQPFIQGDALSIHLLRATNPHLLLSEHLLSNIEDQLNEVLRTSLADKVAFSELLIDQNSISLQCKVAGYEMNCKLNL